MFVGLCVKAQDRPESWKRCREIMIVGKEQEETNERWIDFGSCFLSPLSQRESCELCVWKRSQVISRVRKYRLNIFKCRQKQHKQNTWIRPVPREAEEEAAMLT